MVDYNFHICDAFSPGQPSSKHMENIPQLIVSNTGKSEIEVDFPIVLCPLTGDLPCQTHRKQRKGLKGEICLRTTGDKRQRQGYHL